jgi:hypothetical protein
VTPRGGARQVAGEGERGASGARARAGWPEKKKGGRAQMNSSV